MSGVICDRRVSARLKGKVYRVALTKRQEAVALTKRQEAELELAELKMLRFSLNRSDKNGQHQE